MVVWEFWTMKSIGMEPNCPPTPLGHSNAMAWRRESPSTLHNSCLSGRVEENDGCPYPATSQGVWLVNKKQRYHPGFPFWFRWEFGKFCEIAARKDSKWNWSQCGEAIVESKNEATNQLNNKEITNLIQFDCFWVWGTTKVARWMRPYLEVRSF